MAVTAARQKQFTGRHMLAVMVAFFGVVIAVNVTLAVLANITWSGLVVANGYVASQDFGKDLEKARAQEALGWQAGIAHQNGELQVTFWSREGAKLAGLTAKGMLRRPVTERQDLALAFAETPAGTYAVPVNIEPGLWEVEIDASDTAGHAFKRLYRFVAKARR